MIRTLRGGDGMQLRELLNVAPQINLYMLGNFETLGFGHDFCQFWGDFAPETGELRAIVNRYMNGWGVYGRRGADWLGLGTVVDTCETRAARLQDNPGGCASFLPYLRSYTASQIHVEELMNLEPADFTGTEVWGPTIRRAIASDLDALVEFYVDAGNMSRTRAAIERPLRDTRVFVAEERGRIISSALTNAETLEMAMIGGVYTPPGQRGRGLATAVCSALCQELLGEGRQPVLYWDNAAAGAVYRRIGFKSVGTWRSVWLTRREAHFH